MKTMPWKECGVWEQRSRLVHDWNSGGCEQSEIAPKQGIRYDAIFLQVMASCHRVGPYHDEVKISRRQLQQFSVQRHATLTRTTAGPDK